MLLTTGFQVPKNLGRVFTGKGAAGFQFHDQTTFHQQVRHILANESPILVEDLNGMMLPHLQTRLPETMNKRVLVDFLQMTMRVVNVNIIGNLPDLIAQLLDFFHSNSSLLSALYVFFVANALPSMEIAPTGQSVRQTSQRVQVVSSITWRR